MPLSNTYTKQSEVQRKIDQAKQSTGIDNPEAVKQEIVRQTYSNSPELQGAVQAEKTSTEKMAELANYDQQMAQEQQANMAQAAGNVQAVQQRAAQQADVYDPTDPTSAVAAAENYQSQIDDIYAQPETGLISPFAAEGVAQGVYDQGGAELSANRFTRGLIQSQLGSEAQQLAKLYQSQYEQEMMEKAQKEAERLQEYEMARDYAMSQGGEVYNPYTGETETYPSPQELAAQTADQGTNYILNETAASGKTFLEEVIDDQGSFIDIIRQNPQLTRDEILALANANVNKYGSFQESTEQLRQMGLGFLADAGLNREGVDLIGSFSGGELTPAQKARVYSLPGAKDLISQGKAQSDRDAIALGIAQAGGVDEYRQQMNLAELMNDRELKDQKAITDLVNQISLAEGSFEQFSPEGKNKLGGTGRLSLGIFDPLRSPEERDVIAQAENIKSAFAKQISGATVPEDEMKRLKTFLPDRKKGESQNMEDLQRLRNGLLINQELFEIAKRNNLTPKEAYEQFGASVFNEYNEPVPSYLKQQKIEPLPFDQEAFLDEMEI